MIIERVINHLQHATVNNDNNKHNNNNNSNNENAYLYAYLQTIGTICQSGSGKIGKYLSQIIPQLERFCIIDNNTQTNNNTLRGISI